MTKTRKTQASEPVTRTEPTEALPAGWRWEWRIVPQNWMATHLTGASFWFDDNTVWDTCAFPVPVRVVLAVIRANGVVLV